MSDIARARVLLFALTFVIGGCSATSPAPSSETMAPGSSTASSAATPTATASPGDPSRTVAPTRSAATTTAAPAAPSATAASSETAGLEIDWNAEDLTGIGAVESILGVARAGETFALLASLPYRDETSPEVAIWWSSDGASWVQTKAFPVGLRLQSIAAAGPGFVASGFGDDGGAVWVSADGRDWQRVNDPSLSDGTINQLVVTRSGMVGFGWRSDDDRGSIWTSADGLEWLAATNETGLTVARGLQAVGSYDGRAIAFVSEGDDEPPAIWETTGRAEWTRVGALPDVAWVARVAGGPAGWAAIGDGRAWTSKDGRSWSNAAPGPDVDSDLVADEAGFIAVGYIGSLPGETCGDQRPFAGHTWTSVDGATWRRMPLTEGFKTAMVTKLLVVDRSVLGFGQRADSGYEEMDVLRWSAPLPDQARPNVESDEASVPVSCGG
jgi:hypothetical protein